MRIFHFVWIYYRVIYLFIQPESARYFESSMFANLGSDLIDCHEKGLIL